MAMGAWSATAVSSEIVASNAYRDVLTIQLLTGDTVHLGFGTAAIFGTGVQLRASGDSITVTGHLARGAVNGICDTGNSATGGYQEG